MLLSESHVTTDGQSVSLSWNKAPIWGLGPDICYSLTITVVFVGRPLSGPRQGSPSWVRGPLVSRYFTVSDLRLPVSSSPATRRVTLEGISAAPYIEASSHPWKFLCQKSVATDTRPLKRLTPTNRSSTVDCVRNVYLGLLSSRLFQKCLNKPLPSNGFVTPLYYFEHNMRILHIFPVEKLRCILYSKQDGKTFLFNAIGQIPFKWSCAWP
jgi:hypothetical protein